ncbi:citrate synthase-like protein [Zopfochytrium polystomum]|nr:citrate synthase-like protein [Zopfochytrium polystomum]
MRLNATRNYLTVTDPLTNTTIKVPIHPTLNYIPASSFTQIRIKPTTPPGVTESDTVPVRLYDPGFRNTVVCRSKVSQVDGKNGKLYYRGYDVASLCENSNYLEVAYLLIHGNLPNKAQYEKWTTNIMTHTYLHTEMEKQMSTFRYDAHPMGILIATTASLSTFHPDANPALRGDGLYMKPKVAPGKETPDDLAKIHAAQEIRSKAYYRILGKLPTIAANAYRHRIGRPYNHPMPGSRDYAENLLFMLDRLNEPNYKPDPRLVKILNKMFILNAEHGSNCSTVTMRHLASSGVDPYTALSGAAGALFGERKSTAVIGMLKQIGKVENIQVFLSLVKRKQTIVSGPNGTLVASSSNRTPTGGRPTQPTRLQGFGHRIYKTHDPRVKIAKELALELFEIFGKGPLGELAIALEEATLSDEWFSRRNLFPNIDYWCAIVFHTMGFPADMFPVLMCVPRAAGFIAHWEESIDDPEFKIFRPRQIFVGENERSLKDGSRDVPAVQTTPAPALDKLTEKSLPSAAKKRMSTLMMNPDAKIMEFAGLIEKTQRSIDALSISEEEPSGEASIEVGCRPPELLACKNVFRGEEGRRKRALADLKELLAKQQELMLAQQELAKQKAALDERNAALEAAAAASSGSSGGLSPAGNGKKEPDLLAGSKSPRVMDTKKL